MTISASKVEKPSSLGPKQETRVLKGSLAFVTNSRFGRTILTSLTMSLIISFVA